VKALSSSPSTEKKKKKELLIYANNMNSFKSIILTKGNQIQTPTNCMKIQKGKRIVAESRSVDARSWVTEGKFDCKRAQESF
jgi:hypothetical protein